MSVQGADGKLSADHECTGRASPLGEEEEEEEWKGCFQGFQT